MINKIIEIITTVFLIFTSFYYLDALNKSVFEEIVMLSFFIIIALLILIFVKLDVNKGDNS